MSEQVKNITGAFGRTGLNETADRKTLDVEASGAITAGDVVVWDTQNTDDKPTVAQADVSETTEVVAVAGIAVNAASASGDVVTIVRDGPALCNISTGTVAFKEKAIFHASADGCADGETPTGSEDGDYFGTWLGAEIGSTNQAVLDVRL